MRLAIGIILALLTCCVIWIFRKGGYPTFRAWWDAEGLGIAIVLTILFWAIAERLRL